MIDTTDRTLLSFYNKGWIDCCKGDMCHKFDHTSHETAYNLGYTEYIIGDEVKSLDSQTDVQILGKIHSILNKNS